MPSFRAASLLLPHMVDELDTLKYNISNNATKKSLF